MRPLPILLACCLLLPSLATAGEEPPPAGKSPGEKQPDAEQRKAREKARAGEIGRGLISADEAVRKKAVDGLLARLREGGDVEGFLEHMGKAVSEWASRHERLLEVWLDDAVNGTAEERERAVKLLAALGSAAIGRLADELRHLERHEDRPGVKARKRDRDDGEGEPADAESTAPEPAPAAPVPQVELAVGVPLYYDVGFLLKGGYKRFGIRSILLREADAVSVQEHTNGFTVTASTKGHQALTKHLAGIRATLRDQRLDPSKPKSGSIHGVGAKKEGDAAKPLAAPAPSAPQTAPGVKGDEQVDARVAELAGTKPLPLGLARTTAWRLVPVIMHVPLGGLLGHNIRAEKQELDTYDVLLRGPDVMVGSVADVRRWTRMAQRVPDASGELPLQGTMVVAPERATTLFSGKELRYSKDVRRTKGDAWQIVTGTIRHGIELQVSVSPVNGELHVDLKAKRTEIGQPVPVVKVHPSERAAPVELEQPEWSSTLMTTSFRVSAGGGGAFVPLEGLESGPADQAVLLLTVTPHLPQKATSYQK